MAHSIMSLGSLVCFYIMPKTGRKVTCTKYREISCRALYVVRTLVPTFIKYEIHYTNLHGTFFVEFSTGYLFSNFSLFLVIQLAFVFLLLNVLI